MTESQPKRVNVPSSVIKNAVYLRVTKYESYASIRQKLSRAGYDVTEERIRSWVKKDKGANIGDIIKKPTPSSTNVTFVASPKVYKFLRAESHKSGDIINAIIEWYIDLMKRQKKKEAH